MIDRIGATPPAALTAASATASATAPAADRGDKLRGVARQLEGVFVQELFKAMRETVPTGEGIVSGGAGEDVFTSLMDQHLAAETPKHWQRGLAEAVYRQLSRGLEGIPEFAEPASPAEPLLSPVRSPDA